MNDLELLNQYATGASEAAFAALVRRYTPLVYSSARRRVGTGAADDVTQAVFIVLARKAGPLCRRNLPSLAGWLFRATRLAASETLRQQARRLQREQAAAKESIDMTETNDEATAWEQIKPHLDAALDTLADRDRDAILLRYIQGLSFADVAKALHTSENTATQRVHRATERLHRIFTQKGIVLSAPILAALLATRTVEAAGAELTASCLSLGTPTAQQVGVSAGAALLAQGIVRALLVSQIKTAVLTGVLVLVAGVAATTALVAPPKAPPETEPPFPLCVESLQPMPLTYRGKTTLPEGAVAYQINSSTDGRTHFVKLGEAVDGFRLERHTEKFAEHRVPGLAAPQQLNISELTLRRDGRDYVLVWNEHPSPDTCVASLVAGGDRTRRLVVRVGDIVEVNGSSYQVAVIEPERGQVRVRRLADGKEETLAKASSEPAPEPKGEVTP